MRVWIRAGITLMMILIMGLIIEWSTDPALADAMTVEIQATLTTGVGESLGPITIQPTEYGLLFTPELTGLNPGIHGFHVHQRPDCGPQESMGVFVSGLAAGGHYDPEGTEQHLGPYREGHLGDLPPLVADASGKVRLPVLAPRLQLSDLQGRALIVHEQGDNFSDDPDPLGGGGVRVACGSIR